MKPESFDLYETFYDKGFVKLHDARCVKPVKAIVESNHARYAENENVIDEAQEMYENIGEPEDAWANLCPETERDRDECVMIKSQLQNSDEFVENIPDIQNDVKKADVLYQVQQISVSNAEMLNIVQNLNEIQQKVFYYVRDWCIRKIVNENPAPFHIFLTGGAGTGKSQIVKAINFEASRLFSRSLSSPEALSVLLTAFTGTAAFNIGGNTIHSVFSLTKFLPLPYEPLKEQTLSEIRMKLADLKILVIDEVSMVYKRLLFYIHERLVQIKKCKDPFGGVSVIAVGDFFQLPPVKQRKDERLYKDNASYPIDFWRELFREVEMTEIMRQRDDVPFATALNLLRTRTLEEPLAAETINTVNECIREGPEDVLHVYSTNDEVNTYNLDMLKQKCKDLKQIDAKDYRKDKTSGKLCLREKPCQTKNDSLSSSLLFAVNARVMLTRNCDVKDGLVNGVMGYISHFEHGDADKTNVTGIAVIFDCENVGKQSGKRTKNGNMVLIERIQEEIVIRKSISIVRQQFPLKLSWACTAHKVQGMTVEKVVVNLDRTFAPGQAYVALTRVTSKKGLFIETNDKTKLTNKLYADPDVKSAMEDMQKLALDGPFEIHSNSTKVVFHNIQSLNKHFNHMKVDRRFTKADVICLTETWLKPDQETTQLSLNGFKFHHLARTQAYSNDDDHTRLLRNSKGGGVAFYLKENDYEKQIIHHSIQNIESIAVKFLRKNIVLVNVYRPPTLNVTTFLQSLKSLVDTVKLQGETCIFLGDFNEDTKTKGPIQTFMENNGFNQIVNFFTTEGGTTLDHVYISNPIHAHTARISTFYSYHEAVALFF